MATRFWVGGTGTWSSSNTTNWSATTGGAGGASVPTTADSVAFDTLSGTGTVTTNATTPNCGAITISSANITLQLGAALTSNTTFTLSTGTLNLVSYTLTCPAFTSTGSTARTIAFGTGNITLTTSGTGAWNTTTTTSLTVTGTPVINVVYTGATAITISPGTSATSSGLLSFNFTGGTYPLTITAGHYVNDLNFTGFAGSVVSGTRRIYGNLTCSTGMTWAVSASITTFAATTGTKTITSNGKTLDFPITFGITSGTATWVLQDNLTVGSSRTTTLAVGTLDLNDKDFSTGVFTTSGTLVKSLLMKSGTLSLTGTGTPWNVVSTNFTLTPATSKIALTDTSVTTRNFSGGGLTYNNLEIGGTTGTSVLAFIGNNTFNTISSTKTVAHTILFTAGTTTTVSNWTVTGTAGNVVTINSVTAAGHNLVKTGGGNISVDYMNISWSNASP